MKNIIIILFTSYSISAFLYYYLPINSLLYLFLGFLLLSSFVHLKFQDLFLSKLFINVSTSIQLTSTIVLLFEKLQLNTPDWLIYRDEVITIIGFIALSLISSLKINKNAIKIFVESSIASAMGLAILFSTYSIYGTHHVLLLYPVFSILMYLLLSGKTNRAFEMLITTLILAYGFAFLTAFSNPDNLTGFDLLFPMTWVGTVVAALLFRKEETIQASYTTPVEQYSGDEIDDDYIPYHIRHGNRNSINDYGDRYGNKDFNYSSYQSSIYDDDIREIEPMFSNNISPIINQGDSYDQSNTSSSHNSSKNEAPGLYGLSDAERSKVINEEFYGMPSWFRDKQVEEREFGLPAYTRTDIDKLDD